MLLEMESDLSFSSQLLNLSFGGVLFSSFFSVTL